MPPDWSGGYSSIFALQQEEDWKAADERYRQSPKSMAFLEEYND